MARARRISTLVLPAMRRPAAECSADADGVGRSRCCCRSSARRFECARRRGAGLSVSSILAQPPSAPRFTRAFATLAQPADAQGRGVNMALRLMPPTTALMYSQRRLGTTVATLRGARPHARSRFAPRSSAQHARALRWHVRVRNAASARIYATATVRTCALVLAQGCPSRPRPALRSGLSAPAL